MKIGYLILCHQNPELLTKIVKRVTEGTDNIAVIHVDAKAGDIDRFREPLKDYAQAVFLEKRYPVYWGGMNVSLATLSCMKRALEEGCERVVVFEGMTWPLYSNEYIDKFFTEHKDTEFIRAINATRSRDKGQYMRSFGWYFANVDVKAWNNIKSLGHHFLSIPRKLGIKYRPRGYYFDKKTGKKAEVYWGWAFVSLSRECASYVVKVSEEDKKMRNYFSHVFIPGETYIASIVFNSKFKDRTMDGHELPDGSDVRGITYFEYGKEVRVFNSRKELEGIDGRFLYVRKVGGALD